jgi:hypothetical protein
VTIARVLLIAAGIGLGGYGAWLLATSLSPVQLVALAVWLAAVVVVHDAVLAPTVSTIRARWWGRADRRPALVTATAQVGFVMGAVLSLFVLPEIWAQGRGSPNPTILVGDYAGRLAIVWAAIALVVLVTWRVAVRRARR